MPQNLDAGRDSNRNAAVTWLMYGADATIADAAPPVTFSGQAAS